MDRQGTTIRAGTVLVGDAGGTVWAPGEVSWTGDRLDYVGPPRTSHVPGRLIDLPRGVVFPALVNAHSHAAMSLLRGYADDARLMPWLEQYIWPAEQRLSAEDVYWGTLLAAAEMIRSGIGAFLDMYMFPEAVARAAEEAGLRAAIAWGLVGDWPEAQPRVDEVVRLAERWRTSGLVQGWLGPHAPYTCSEALLRQVGERARLHGIPVHIHVAESREEGETVAQAHRATPVGYMDQVGLLGPRTVLAHAVELSDDDVRRLADTGTAVAHCPVSNLKLGNGTARVTDLLQAGVTVALGTDGPASTNTLDMFLEMRAAAWLQKARGGDPQAFGAQAALALATRHGARALGLDSGELVAGKAADVAAARWWAPHLVPVHDPFSALVYATRPEDVCYTVVAGRLLLDDGVITTFDEAAVLREAEQRGFRLVQGGKPHGV
jgi:5-methylthioadenosine/S-adenosylhomocysteine deaminase